MRASRYHIEDFKYDHCQELIHRALHEWMHTREQLLGGPDTCLKERLTIMGIEGYILRCRKELAASLLENARLTHASPKEIQSIKDELDRVESAIKSFLIEYEKTTRD